MAYQHILVATDLMDDNIEVVTKAQELASKYQAQLSLVHVVESLPGYASGYSGVVDLEEEMKQDAKQKLAEFGEKFGVAVANQHLGMGSPKIVILHTAEKINADMIVVGSHGRHGLSLLLGSTASAVLHAGHSDVLVVHQRKNKTS